MPRTSQSKRSRQSQQIWKGRQGGQDGWAGGEGRAGGAGGAGEAGRAGQAGRLSRLSRQRMAGLGTLIIDRWTIQNLSKRSTCAQQKIVQILKTFNTNHERNYGHASPESDGSSKYTMSTFRICPDGVWELNSYRVETTLKCRVNTTRC